MEGLFLNIHLQQKKENTSMPDQWFAIHVQFTKILGKALEHNDHEHNKKSCFRGYVTDLALFIQWELPCLSLNYLFHLTLSLCLRYVRDNLLLELQFLTFISTLYEKTCPP